MAEFCGMLFQDMGRRFRKVELIARACGAPNKAMLRRGMLEEFAGFDLIASRERALDPGVLRPNILKLIVQRLTSLIVF
jgi:hypothetical protein